MPKKLSVGRPKLPKGRAKAGMLRVRVTRDELEAIESRAKQSKQSVSDWIRSILRAAF